MSLSRTIKSIGEDERKENAIKAWKSYPVEQLKGNAPNQSVMYFDSLPAKLRNSFFQSTNPVLQLGAASAQFMSSKRLANRHRIGYDYTDESVNCMEINNITARKFDLNSPDSGKLAEQLAIDLQQKSDILAIRILEYLTPEAAINIIFTLMNTAQPGSVFYVETDKVFHIDDLPIVFNKLDDHYIASFFGARTDMQFDLMRIEDEISDNKKIGKSDQLVIRKI